MRILYIHNFYRSEMPSGEDSVVEQDLALLRDAGHEVRLLAARSDDIAGAGLAAKMLVPAGVLWNPSSQRRAAQTVAEFGPDIVHVHNTFPLLSPSVLYGVKEHDVPVVATLHNFRTSCAQGFFTREDRECFDCLGPSTAPAIQHRCYRDSAVATAPLAASIQLHRSLRSWPRHVDRFITMSEHSRSVFERAGLPAEKLTVRPHCISEPEATREGLGSGALFVGRLTPDKGATWLVEQWPDAGPPLRMVGDGPDRARLERLVAARPPGTVELLGRRSRDEVRRLMCTARVLISPSRSPETFGLTAAEALSVGLPVVGTSIGATPEVVRDGVSGVIFEHDNPESLRKAVTTAMDPERNAQLSAGALREYAERFSPTASLDSLMHIYEAATTA